MQGLVPDIGITYATTNNGDTKLKTPPLKKGPAKIKRLREQSLAFHGVRLFNSLPQHLRDSRDLEGNDLITVDDFKKELDKILWLIPDEPYSPTRGRCADSNSIIDQMTYLNRCSRKTTAQATKKDDTGQHETRQQNLESTKDFSIKSHST